MTVADAVERMSGVPVLLCAADGPTLRGYAGAMAVLGEVFERKAAWVAVPVQRLDADFFRLRTGVAGDFAQKLTQYRIGLAVLGDVTAHTAASAALRDLVRECDRGNTFWFVRDVEELRERMSASVASGRTRSVWEAS